jgi:hypothetical protein
LINLVVDHILLTWQADLLQQLLHILAQFNSSPFDLLEEIACTVLPQGLSSVRSYEKVARFKLIWWDKGSGSRDGVSIWHPIVPPGCAMLGDLAFQGSQSGEAWRGFHFGIQWHHLAALPWDALPANLQYLNLMEPIMCVVSATSL